MPTDDARNATIFGAALTDVCMDHCSSGLVQSLSLPPLRTIPKYFTGSRTSHSR
ncbi:hypothetical protein CY34DRAFT_813396 [Suillus luteus UH-Slu-Lm8-n1]|uniref:Uncharacterized protein n=1 Tax=Suillus luteus UH-Slu-Lm8-n1 TaxID=930992 RepID=A0A0C9Z883_9AGAM|nr:hypothetical protein CY34DRAFT_813396 [Suillus luteus UH-Slu-Lm8-n1]